ncbi:MAG: response regulator [Planctomycetes bacterium]|nr:response regulator [Planctomycetota bacterium]
MDILLIERDHLVRDQVKVGLQQFPEFTVACGEGYAAVNELRQKHFDCVFLGVNTEDKEGLKLLKHLRSFERSVEVVVMTSARNAKDMARDKSKMNIGSFLTTPIEAPEFFRLVSRMRDRKAMEV